MSGWGDRIPRDSRCARTDPHARHTWGTDTCPGMPGTVAAAEPDTVVVLRRLDVYLRGHAERLRAEHVPTHEECPHAQGIDMARDHVEAMIDDLLHRQRLALGIS